MIALVALAPLAEGWTFDLYSALIGAAMVCLLFVLLYRSRAALQRAWSGLASSVRRLARYFQASAEDIYRQRVAAHVRGLILPAYVGPLSALFVEPSLAPPPPCPQSVPEARVGPALSKPRMLHEIFGNHSRFAVLGAPGAGRTTLLAHLAAVAADPAEDSSSAEALNSQPDVRERLPLYVNLGRCTARRLRALTGWRQIRLGSRLLRCLSRTGRLASLMLREAVSPLAAPGGGQTRAGARHPVRSSGFSPPPWPLWGAMVG